MARPLTQAVERLTFTVDLPAPAERVWERATRLQGVNEELAPLVRMTAPRALRDATIADLTPGEPAGRSWLLLGGILPVDFDDLCVAEIEPPRRFLERSRMLSMSRWEHERVIEPAGAAACRLTDTVTFELRHGLRLLPGARRLAAAIVRMVFRHRHRRLPVLHAPGQG